MTTVIINKSPIQADVTVTQGDTWELVVRLGGGDPVEYTDLTGWVGRAQVRRKSADADAGAEALAEMTVTVDPDQTTNAGYFTVTLDAEDCAALPERCRWDLEFDRGASGVKTFFAGKFTVEREVTRG